MYSKNVTKTSEEESKKRPASLLKISPWDSSVSACANEPPGFSVMDHRLQMGYSKQLMD